ncbi:hypothetical protein GALMADRAFT_254634 [Galerina marginata CBS 339.88]|uniref:Uncharacterized protein n=1 Tax=Galerina marginata (strain CBS 339.88) TaxID=685588 RepID=A0A067SHZ2_GALM3|nr:hypothetical protein GALMADRAFT_254634 [Galerina marginata CBS 339.88]
MMGSGGLSAQCSTRRWCLLLPLRRRGRAFATCQTDWYGNSEDVLTMTAAGSSSGRFPQRWHFMDVLMGSEQ